MMDFLNRVKDFFINLYESFIQLSFVQWTINYCKQNVVMACIVGGILAFIILTLIIIRIATRKKRKAKKAAKKAAKLAKKQAKKDAKQGVVAPAVVEEPVKEEPVVEVAEATETPVVEAAEVVEEPVAEVAEEPVVEVAEVAEEPAEEVVEEPTPVVAEETPVVEAVEEEIEAEDEATEEVEDDDSTHAIFKMLENVDESTPEQLRDNYEENETDKQARYTGKWVVCRVITSDEAGDETYFFELHASKGEKLFASEDYTTYQGVLRGIQTHKTNILNGNIKITTTKKGDYIFKVLSGKNMLLCQGENYPTRARCESAVESTKRFAQSAIVDENVQDIVVKVPQEDDAPLPPPSNATNGKWIIFSGKDENNQTIYTFELFANNGERLLSSEDYTTYIGAINGIQTYKNNIQKDNFRISLTKRGDYIYKVLNGNGQLLCLGEHYKTKRLCQNAVESVKRFALASPVLTEDKK